MNSTACPSCKVVVKYKDEFAGRKMRCPRCKTVFTLPAVKLARVSAAKVVERKETSRPSARADKPTQSATTFPLSKSAKAAPPPRAGKPAKVTVPVPDDLDSQPEQDLEAMLAAAQEDQEAAVYDQMESTDETPVLPKTGGKKGVGDLAETEEFLAVRQEEEAVIDMIDESLAPARNKARKPRVEKEPFPDSEAEEQSAPVSDPDDIEIPDVDEEEPPAPRGKKGKAPVVEQEEEIESPEDIEQEEEAPRKPVRPPLPATPPNKQKGGGGGSGGVLLMVLVFVLSVAVGLGGYYLILISSGV